MVTRTPHAVLLLQDYSFSGHGQDSTKRRNTVDIFGPRKYIYYYLLLLLLLEIRYVLIIIKTNLRFVNFFFVHRNIGIGSFRDLPNEKDHVGPYMQF